MPSRFLFNQALWDEFEARLPAAKMVRAAVAYLGTGGSKLLPLRSNDELLVDMSLASVRAGTTNPSEVKKFLRRGVKVYSRDSLHAKFIIIDDVLIAGSSNISKHAKHCLDEAAVLTNDRAAVRQASATFRQLCTEPVRKDYLAKCIREYRPPRFGGNANSPRRKGPRNVQGKVWIIGGLRCLDIPESEGDQVERAVKTASKKLFDFERSEVLGDTQN